MTKRGRIVGVIVATAALTIPAVADANKIRHRGSVQGDERSKVQFKVKKKKGDLVKVTGLQFRRVDVTCDDGAVGEVTARIPDFRLKGKKFTRKGPLRGPGINNGSLRAFGKLRSGGRKAKGNVRIAFKSDSGAGCGTGRLN
jgi:hypothetical protein